MICNNKKITSYDGQLQYIYPNTFFVIKRFLFFVSNVDIFTDCVIVASKSELTAGLCSIIDKFNNIIWEPDTAIENNV